MWFLFSLIALLFWSGSDLFSKLGSRPEDKNSHWKMVMAVGLVMGLHALWQLTVGGITVRFADILTYLPASFFYISSMILGYVALRYIELSVSSPICNCSGAVAAVLCFLFLQEMPNGWQWFGVACVAFGLLALGITERRENEEAKELRRRGSIRYRRSVIALLFPLLYCLLDAAGTFVDAVILREEPTDTLLDTLFSKTLTEDCANVCYELTFLAMGIFAAIWVLLVKRERLLPAKEKGETSRDFLRREGPKLGGALCETAGQFAYIYAIGNTATAGFSAAIISSYCALSVLWSRLFLKEKLSLAHYLSILLAFVGIVVLGVFDA